MFDHARIWMKEKYRALLDDLRRTQRMAARNPQKFGLTGAVLLLVVIIALSAKKVVRYLRNLRISRNPTKSPSHAASLWYQRMTRLLSRRGLPKLPSQTPEEFLLTIDENEIRSSVAAFTQHYERARFGGSSEDAEKLPGLYQEVEEQVKR